MRSDFNWFLNHYDELYKQYGHKFLVIKDKAVIGVYDDFKQAVDETDEAPGTFIVQECNGDSSAYTNCIASFCIV